MLLRRAANAMLVSDPSGASIHAWLSSRLSSRAARSSSGCSERTWASTMPAEERPKRLEWLPGRSSTLSSRWELKKLVSPPK